MCDGVPRRRALGADVVTQVRYFAAAAEAAGTGSESVEAATVGELRDRVVAAHGADLQRVLARCALLVDGRRVDDDRTVLHGSEVVDVLPPFAGG